MPGTYNPYKLPQNQADWAQLRPSLQERLAQQLHDDYGGPEPAENFIRQQRPEGAAHLGNLQPSPMASPPTSLFPTPQTPPIRRAPPVRRAPQRQQGLRPATNLPSPTTRGSAPFPGNRLR